ncbi:MAG TPA: GNAT family protein [Acidobacteriota bacterium]|nr:GNAT family protein [Acidobacteriota bacterium]
MYLLRPALLEELSLIHQMQNIPHREKVFTEPLPPLKEFIESSSERMQKGEEFYYIFEVDGKPVGFIEYLSGIETTSVWGRWLNTLIYGCGVLAFYDLNFSKLSWYTRAINKPMLAACSKFKFRRVGENEVCTITDGFGFIAVGKNVLFEIKSEEFKANQNWMEKLCHPLQFRFRNPENLPDATNRGSVR